MSNYGFSLYIKPEDIYNKLLPEQRGQFSNIKIINATLFNDELHIDCLALEKEVLECQYRQKLLDDGFIIVKEEI